jgi:O-antigen ligase
MHKNDVNSRLVILFLVSVFFVYQTYARTGWLTLIFGVAVFSYLTYGNKGRYYIGLFFLLVISLPFILSNEIIMSRLSDQNIYIDQPWWERVGSGRLVFSYYNIVEFISFDFFNIIWGIGKQASMDVMENNIGLRIFSHNGFVDSLNHHGVVGFILFISFFIGFLRRVLRVKHTKKSIYPFCMSIFIMFVLFNFVQGGNVFILNVMIGSVLFWMRYHVNEFKGRYCL